MPSKEIEEYQVKGDAQIRVFALTIVGVALNSILAIPAYQAVINLLWYPQTQQSTMLVTFFFLNVIVTPIYCWGASLAFYPKRIVNPLYIQLATVGVVTIFLLVINAHQFLSPQLLFNFLSGIIGTFLISVFFLGIFGVSRLLLSGG